MRAGGWVATAPEDFCAVALPANTAAASTSAASTEVVAATGVEPVAASRRGIVAALGEADAWVRGVRGWLQVAAARPVFEGWKSGAAALPAQICPCSAAQQALDATRFFMAAPAAGDAGHAGLGAKCGFGLSRPG